MNEKINYFRIVKIIFFAAIVGLIYNSTSVNGLSLIRVKTELVAANDSLLFSENEKDTVLRFLTISTEQAYKFYNSGKAVFIDARDQWDFADGHIPGAINIPEFSYEPDDSTANSIDKNQRYIIYCHGNDCDVALRLAKELKKLKFKNLLIYSNGWAAWTSAGYAVEKENSK